MEYNLLKGLSLHRLILINDYEHLSPSLLQMLLSSMKYLLPFKVSSVELQNSRCLYLYM